MRRIMPPPMDKGLHPAPTSAAGRLATLEARNGQLEQQLRELTQEVQRNEALLRRTQERELELLRADSLPQLIDRIINGLRRSYALDDVGLVLHDPQHEIRHLLTAGGAWLDELQGVQFVDALAGLAPQIVNLDRPWLGRYRRVDHERLLPRAGFVGSLAIIPLRRAEQLDGVLVFSSSDPLRFTRQLASDFLAHLGVIAAICLENAVNRARLVRSGVTDFLTGFHNRRYLHARLREELARAQRAGHSLVCLMIDVDHFKRINDHYGHLAGDNVLREVAERIEAEMRISDTSARFGGDEFAMVLVQATLSDGERVATRILEAVRGEPIAASAQANETITLSIGVAAAAPAAGPQDYKALTERLIAEADAALYRAKSAGRNQVAMSETEIK